MNENFFLIQKITHQEGEVFWGVVLRKLGWGECFYVFLHVLVGGYRLFCSWPVGEVHTWNQQRITETQTWSH